MRKKHLLHTKGRACFWAAGVATPSQAADLSCLLPQRTCGGNGRPAAQGVHGGLRDAEPGTRFPHDARCVPRRHGRRPAAQACRLLQPSGSRGRKVRIKMCPAFPAVTPELQKRFRVPPRWRPEAHFSEVHFLLKHCYNSTNEASLFFSKLVSEC